MVYLLYSFLFLWASLAFKQTNNQLFLVLAISFVFFLFFQKRKKAIKWIIVILFLSFFLKSNFKTIKLKTVFSGYPINIQSRSFVLKGFDYNVLIYSKQAVKKDFLITVYGKSQPFLKRNFYDFDIASYYKRKNIAYYFNNPQIKAPYKLIKKEIIKTNYVDSWRQLLFFNNKNEDNQKLYSLFQKIGLGHLVIISSFHFTLIYWFLISKFKTIFSNTISNIIIIGLLVAFSALLNFSISSIKALSVLVLSIILSKHLNKTSIVSLVGIIILIITPKNVLNLSFVLSVGFSLLISLMINDTLLVKMSCLRLIGWFIELYFTGIISLLNFFYLYLSPVIFIFYLAAAIGIESFLRFGEFGLIMANKYNINIVLGIINQWWFLLIFIILLWIIYYLQISFKRARYSFFILLIILTIFYLQQPNNFITFINVGQGDSSLVVVNNQRYLIDVGGHYSYNVYQKILKPYLLKEKINYIDQIFISHNDLDHSGSLHNWDNAIKVKMIHYHYNKNSYFTNLNQKNWKSKNNNSQVLFFKYQNNSVLFTGDIDFKVENYLINQYPNLKIDILKVGHHGSKFSTSTRFLKHFQFTKAVISVGKNHFNHPSSAVIKRLKKENIKVYITQKDGAIKLNLDTKKWTKANVL